MTGRSVRAALVAAVAFSGVFSPPGAWAEDAARFEDYEIRVIRPRYFAKRDRVELGAATNVIMNQSFVYSFLASGILTWHFSEGLGLEAQAAYGFSADKDDKRLLKETFGIRTVVLRTESLLNGRLLWTPSYGKFQLPTGRIVYFDTFLAAGAGTTGVRLTYDHCDEAPPEPPAATTKQYPTLVLGLGQRYFLDKESSVRLGMDVQRFQYDGADTECDPANAASVTKANDNVLLVVGYTRFF